MEGMQIGVNRKATMVFPAELIDYILSFLRQDISALKACSNAHPFLSKLAERHLYTRILVGQHSDAIGVSELYQQFSENSRILEYPRVLEFLTGHLTVNLPILPIISMIPQMANLKSLEFCGIPCSFKQYDDFISTFRTCLQQSSIEELVLFHFFKFPFSVIDHSKSIKQLTLSGCTAMEEPISSTGVSQQPLDSLIIFGHLDPDVLPWATSKVTSLTSLELWNFLPESGFGLTAFPVLLTACSNSLTTFRLDIADSWRSTYQYNADHPADYWVNNFTELPFTLSSFMHLKRLSVSGLIDLTMNKIFCALPAIVPLIQSAPAIDSVVLAFYCRVEVDIAFLGRLDWALLGRLHSDFSHIHPHIGLRITAEDVVDPSLSPDRILDALAGNKNLMDLVKRGLVDLK